MRRIRRVAVLGAGVMGAAIAAHLTNAGLEVLLLDKAPTLLGDDEKAQGLDLDHPAVKIRTARLGVERALQAKPAAFFRPLETSLITLGNFEDNMNHLQACDWVIEAVVENYEIKQALLAQAVPHLREDAVLSTNTSGLSVTRLAEGLPEAVRPRFLGTHFFNPPRYMHLMELIPTRDTDAALLDEMADFLRTKLGKGIVKGKDTPNFVGNRIGVFAMFNAMQHLVDMGISVELADGASGPASARPKTAIFRTADLVGIDTLVHVARNSFQALEKDEAREVFDAPGFLRAMVDKGLLGDKAGQGFYRKQKGPQGTRIQHLDLQTLEYVPAGQPLTESLKAASRIENPAERLKTFLGGEDEAARFAWLNLRDTLIYALRRIPEIADSIEDVDNAMKWGFGWELGPFEMLDAIGVEEFAARARKEGVALPESLLKVKELYRFENGTRRCWSLVKGAFENAAIPPGEIRLSILKRGSAVVESTANSSIVDLGDGVFGLEFHSKMNSISPDMLEMTLKAVGLAESQGLALVVGNQGPVFSAGANLGVMIQALQDKEPEKVMPVIQLFQRATMSLKYGRIPVVAAPFNMALGGGCEYCLHADALVAHGETYMGLVEVGVGLLPAGGGCREMTLRALEEARHYNCDVAPMLFKAFEQIGMAKVSGCALDLFEMGYMRRGDSVCMNGDLLLAEAKKKALSLVPGYRAPRIQGGIPAPGRSISASMKSRLWNLRMGGFISEHDELIGSKIADVLCGGDVAPGTPLTEDYLLELEREAFMSLLGEAKTQERIVHMLKTGKALRN